MKLKTTIFILIYILSHAAVFAQDGIDYNNALLTRSLKRIGISDISSLHEMSEINSANKKHDNGNFFLIQENQEYRYLYIGRVISCRTETCNTTRNQTANNVNPEHFDYYILFDRNKTIQSVKIFKYNASHGQEITARSWLKQFIGFNGSEKLQSDKNIDAISGATISVNAIIQDIEIRTQQLKAFND
jgi:hypothetical protein